MFEPKRTVIIPEVDGFDSMTSDAEAVVLFLDNPKLFELDHTFMWAWWD